MPSPIVIGRESGEVVSTPQLTQDQKDTLWEAYVRAYIRIHPEIFKRKKPACGGTQ